MITTTTTLQPYLSWYTRTDKLGAMVTHVGADHLGQLLVEASQKDGAHHDGGVEAETGQEAGTLQCYVGCPDHQCLAGTVRQRKEIITTNKGYTVKSLI